MILCPAVKVSWEMKPQGRIISIQALHDIYGNLDNNRQLGLRTKECRLLYGNRSSVSMDVLDAKFDKHLARDCVLECV